MKIHEYNEMMAYLTRPAVNRVGFRFGGGKKGQMMGSAASQKYFKERKVYKPTPVFEGPAGGA